MSFSDLDQLCINAIRTLSIDAIEKANSGHPGLPLGAAPMAYVLWQRHLRHNPYEPGWPGRDRFVLSAGHGSMLLYSLLHLTGYDLQTSELQSFRQWESRTPGHPEAFVTPGVEATTGPLGQGSANAVGMAMAERALAHRFNRPGFRVMDHMTYALVSDGDLMEGLSQEAASLAGHLGLGQLVYLWDDNQISLDGPTSLTFTEDVGARYEACGWQVLRVSDGDTDLAAIDRALVAARENTSQPTLICVRTTIGYGAPTKAGTSSVHGSPLGQKELEGTKQALGWKAEPFSVPDEVREHFAKGADRGRDAAKEWKAMLGRYQQEHTDAHREFLRTWSGELPEGWASDLPSYRTGEKLATRQAGGAALNALAARVPGLLGGDADLGCSTTTVIKDGGSFAGDGSGRNIHFGVREHAMGAICNGMAYHGGVRPFAATFFCFSDYMRPAVRLAALNGLPVIYVWTHDSVGLGEDGPTHQPVEQLMSLRAMPNLWMLRPGDANETIECWRVAMLRRDGPAGLVLSRQKLPVLEGTAEKAHTGVARGAYVLADTDGTPEVLLLATGAELCVAMEARSLLERDGIGARVVSMPCWESFMEQGAEYQERVLPRAVRARVAVEAGITLGWERWVGTEGRIVGIDRYGASAPGPVVLEKLGITADNVARKAKQCLDG